MAAALELGYDDERFESVVSKNYHCVICLNVFKDPVMCRNNEHLFCRTCITKHLVNSKKCPTCMQKLSVNTLREAPRFVTRCLAELRIRCDYFDRGCGFVELEKLERHVKECDYAPVTCSNEGCKLEMNKRDLIHHETAVCEQRRVKCHDCGQMRQELNKVNAKLDNIETRFTQLIEILKQMNVNLEAQNKLARLETLETQNPSLALELNTPETNTEYKICPENESEKLESEDERGMGIADELRHAPKGRAYERRDGEYGRHTIQYEYERNRLSRGRISRAAGWSFDGRRRTQK